MDIFLIRHTTPEVNKGICYGQTDLELKASFSEELKVLKHKVTDEFDQVYSSPLSRCLRLAEGLTNSFQVDDRLKELNFGDWEMKAWNDIPQDEITPWMNDFVSTQPPNGESFQQLIERTEDFFKEVLQMEHERVAVVAHAGVIRAALGFFLGLTPENLFRISVDYGGISKITSKTGNHQLLYLNR